VREGIVDFDVMPPPVVSLRVVPAFVVFDGEVAGDGELGLVEGYCCASAAPATPIVPVSASATSIGLLWNVGKRFMSALLLWISSTPLRRFIEQPTCQHRARRALPLTRGDRAVCTNARTSACLRATPLDCGLFPMADQE